VHVAATEGSVTAVLHYLVSAGQCERRHRHQVFWGPALSPLRPITQLIVHVAASQPQTTAASFYAILQASAGAGTDTRRVGPFTVTPVDARKLLVSQVEAAERARAEQEIARLTGAQQVR
jgi:hypothetical protein